MNPDHAAFEANNQYICGYCNWHMDPYCQNYLDHVCFATKAKVYSDTGFELVVDDNNIVTVEVNSDSESFKVDNCNHTENNRNKFEIKWTSEETNLLLDKYENYMIQVGPQKKFKTKKKMWEKIASDVNNIFKKDYTPVQVENRYKTILKRKKEAVENNSHTGESREEVPFEAELSKIAALDDSIQPEVLQSGNNVRVLKTPTNAQKKAKRSKNKSIEETLEEIFKRKEENKERRHREKMALFEKFFNK